MAGDIPPIPNRNAATNLSLAISNDTIDTSEHAALTRNIFGNNKRLSFAAGLDNDAVQQIPAVMSGAGPSNSERYSIYSNIKDGKVRMEIHPIVINNAKRSVFPPAKKRLSTLRL